MPLRAFGVVSGPQVINALEGNYSNWSIYDSLDDADFVTAGAWFHTIVETSDGKSLQFINENDNYVKQYTIATKTLAAKTVIDAIPACYFFRSALGKYFVSLSAGRANLLIWKNGLLVQTTAMASLGLTSLYDVGIGFSGKYVLLSGVRTASGNKGWVILVGA